MVTDQDIEQLRKLLQMMNEERCLKLTLADGTTLERDRFTAKEKPQDASSEQQQPQLNPFGFRDDEF